MSQRPPFTTAARRLVEAGIADLRVSMPARVESYDAATRRASVQPVLRASYIDEDFVRQTERLPVIHEVPVVVPGSGGARLKFPVAAGDHVLLVFADQSLDRYLGLGGDDVDPEDHRAHCLTDAIAIAGLAPSGGDADVLIEVTDTEVNLGGGATEAAVHGTAYRSAEDTLLTALGAFATTVSGIVDGGASGTTLNTAITTFQGAAASYLSTIVKVK